jgi:hypothetical protein
MNRRRPLALGSENGSFMQDIVASRRLERADDARPSTPARDVSTGKDGDRYAVGVVVRGDALRRRRSTWPTMYFVTAAMVVRRVTAAVDVSRPVGA